jgi:hypothetical protein
MWQLSSVKDWNIPVMNKSILLVRGCAVLILLGLGIHILLDCFQEHSEGTIAGNNITSSGRAVCSSIHVCSQAVRENARLTTTNTNAALIVEFDAERLPFLARLLHPPTNI